MIANTTNRDISLSQEQDWENDRLLVICEFLETIIQSILYVRKVYSSDLFEKVITPCTNQITYAFRAKEMREYVGNCILSMKPWLRQKLVQSVVLKIVTTESITESGSETAVVKEKIVEQFVFEMEMLRMNTKKLQKDSTTLFGQLYWVLRDFYVKVHSMSGQYTDVYSKLSENEKKMLSFRIQTNVINSNELGLTNKLDWLIVSKQSQLNQDITDGNVNNDSTIMSDEYCDESNVTTSKNKNEEAHLLIPLKSVGEVHAGLQLQLFVKQ